MGMFVPYQGIVLVPGFDNGHSAPQRPGIR
jgi:hypothetical protein